MPPGFLGGHAVEGFADARSVPRPAFKRGPELFFESFELCAHDAFPSLNSSIAYYSHFSDVLPAPVEISSSSGQRISARDCIHSEV
jgi:hypothetical protein